ncbi:MAG: glycosyltransferase [Bacteroidota bacterium]
MKVAIVIPAHNEEEFLSDCLDSFVDQSYPPEELILVDDNSSDSTYEIARIFAKKYPWITAVQRKSKDMHLPGKKVVDAFNFGVQQLSKDFDLIGKFDADILLPINYFEQMRNHFQANWLLGMCSGLLYVKKKDQWVYENIANKDHVRGPVKLYFRQVFELMGGLRSGTGWDTVDVLLCKYHDFEVRTDDNLMVKHLRPTGFGYHKKNYRNKGEALYKMRYGLPLAKLALLKMTLSARRPTLYVQGMLGYLNAWLQGASRFVTPEEGKFIRKLRWKGILGKLR